VDDFYRIKRLPPYLCPRCAGPRRIVGAVTEPHAVRRLLVALARPSWGTTPGAASP
jgi:hypothetical protein